jgi:hypothetical protein
MYNIQNTIYNKQYTIHQQMHYYDNLLIHYTAPTCFNLFCTLIRPDYLQYIYILTDIYIYIHIYCHPDKTQISIPQCNQCYSEMILLLVF